MNVLVSPYLIILWVVYFSSKQVASTVTWYSFSGSSSWSENYDSSATLDGFRASCRLEWQDCSWWDIFSFFCNDRSETKDCSCYIDGNPASGLFYLSGSSSWYSLMKSSCSQTSCGNYPSASACSTSNGCASAGSHSIPIRCSASNSEDSTSSRNIHRVTFTAESPTFSITNLDGSVSASRTWSTGTVFFTTQTTSGLQVMQYVESSSVSNSWLLGTSYLFRLNTGTGQVYVNRDLSLEYSYTFYMTICAYSRRQGDCGQLTITFNGCFQRPTCNDKTNTVADTHAIGGTLFTMTVPGPTDHFPSFSSTFQNLGYAIDSSTLSVATIDPSSGVITTTGNVTVHPNYPDKLYTIVVRVSNTDSCTYTSTCTMQLTATFTNWPVEIRSLDRSVTVHEDTDARTMLHQIIVFDYNHPDEDNVTCIVTQNDDTYLFEMLADGSIYSPYEYNSYRIWKKQCQDAGCGWLCPLMRGCLSHNITQSYTFSVRCDDAYGSFDTGTLTINIQQNAAPVWTNLPRTITVNTDTVAYLDVIFTIYYSDYENEDLNYNYTISPAQPTPALFSFDSFGNYYNNPVNVTSLQYQWPLGNETYTVYVCGYERRNTICDTLTILQRDFCGPTPSCANEVNTVTDQFAVGSTLFTIDTQGTVAGTPSFAIFASDPELFEVDSFTGIVTSRAALPIAKPPNTTSYSITANVYDTSACGYGVCHLSLDVTFTNFDISIDNMGSVVTNLHEDTMAENTLHTIATSDPNPVDGVSCAIDEANSVPPNNGKFVCRETTTGSGEYIILNKENPGFDYDNATSYTIAVTCSDLYGSSDTASMTVNIDENDEPVITNLPASINIDPITFGNGAQIFTLTATDTENDPLTHYCNVSDSEVPLECETAILMLQVPLSFLTGRSIAQYSSKVTGVLPHSYPQYKNQRDGVVSMRRNLIVPAENGRTYQITMCVIDSSHSHTVCGALSTLVSASKTNPVISNLPATRNVDESANVGSLLFTVSVTDPDAMDIHTYTLENVSPEDAGSKFNFVGTSGELYLASSLNYETQVTYNFTFSVRDTYLPGLTYKMLYLQVNDINEAPSLTLHTTSLSTTEGNVGQVIGTVLYDCTDVDSGQTLTLAISGGTHMSYFSLDSATGQLTFAQNWDFESVTLPISTVLVLTCSDGVGLTDSGTLTVSVSPVNEFAPVPSITEIEIIIYSTQRIQDAMLSVSATDADVYGSGQLTYGIAGTGEGSQYFMVSSTGSVYLSNYISWDYNYTFQFTVEISDNETSPKAGFVNVTVHYIAPEIDTTVTYPTKCMTCSTEGTLVVVVLGIGGGIVFLLLIHAMVRTKIWTLCQSEVTNVRSFDKVSKPRYKGRRAIREQLKRDLQNISDEDEEQDSDEDNIRKCNKRNYQVSQASLNQALPKRQPPGPFSYANLPNMTDLPEPASYSAPSSNISNTSQSRLIPDGQKPSPQGSKQNLSVVDQGGLEKPRKNKSSVPSRHSIAPSPDSSQLYGSVSIPGIGQSMAPKRMFNVKKATDVAPVQVTYQSNKKGASNAAAGWRMVQ